MSDIYCVPIKLYPTQLLQFKRCTVVPGLTIRKFEGQIATIIKNFSKKHQEVVKIQYPTHLIYINENLYFENLKIRLEKEEKELPRRIHLDAFSLAKQTIMAMILARRLTFSMHGIFCLSRSGKKAHLKAFSNTDYYEIHNATAYAFLKNIGDLSAIETSKISHFGKLLDRYYREGIWSSDRYAMALTHFWGSLCKQVSVQLLMVLT